MSDSIPPVKVPETMTTREEMDFDDNENEREADQVDTAGTATTKPAATKSPSPKPRVSFQEVPNEIPPSKPPRPLNPQQEAENTLIEAFPSIDTKVVRAVLAASGGKVEPAFNALLGMTDPDFKPEEEAPVMPPRPTARQPPNQLEADEVYARQLAEEYNDFPQRGQHSYNQREMARRGPNRQDDGEERNFFDDDLPEIGRNIQQGFAETQKKFNSWISNLKKRMDGDEDDEELYSAPAQPPRRQNFGPSQSEQLYGIRKNNENSRRSTEAQRYDADPHELGDEEFKRLELRDDDAPPPPMPPRTSSRQPTNPDLFKAQPKLPRTAPIDEVDAADRSSDKAKKWQPLTSIAPNPEEDNDPFSVGDDEDDSKAEDLRKEDTERLKSAARESVAEEPAKELKEDERSGSAKTRNKEAEDLLAAGAK